MPTASAPASPSDIIGSLVAASSPAVSPDGSQVAFVVSRTDVDANTYRSQVWIADTDGSTRPRPLTDGRHGGGSPVWSPDGRFLAFTSSRGEEKTGKSSLHVLPVDGPGETITVCTRKEGMSEVAWSPDGTMLAFVSRARDDRYDEDDAAKQPARKITRFVSRLDSEGWVYDRPEHIWVVPADGTVPPEDLTPGEFHFRSPSWLPDSSGLVVSGEGHDTWDRDLATDLHLVTLDGERRRLTEATGIYSSPSVSPDGTRVAFLGVDDPENDVQNAKVGILDLAGGPHRWVSTGLDRPFTPMPGARAPIWRDDHLISSAEDRGSSRCYRVDPAGERAPEPFTPEGVTIPGFDAAADAVTVVVALATPTTPPEIHVVTGDGETRRLTHLTDRRSARTAPRPMEHFLAPSTDGAEVDTWVLTPPDFDPEGSYPVLLNVHGGPFTQYGYGYFDEAQFQAAAGFLVVMSNPRGSSGRETAWGQAIMGPKHATAPGRGWGSVDVDDVLAALDEALRRYTAADRDRVGVLGGSYGGYMASWLAGHHGDRFKAICSERSVNNLLSEEWNSDIATLFRTHHGPTHIEDPDEYRRMSPITYVERMTTPMLILHSEDDLRCPIVQAEELFVALRLLDRDPTFYRFPAESHELTRSGSPKHRIERADIILDFFRTHLMPATA
ncbi:MAG: S9 family peptidase [Actinomycetota bacterium]|nr:S9 family peptidase [Actinomycetota bacterium]